MSRRTTLFVASCWLVGCAGAPPAAEPTPPVAQPAPTVAPPAQPRPLIPRDVLFGNPEHTSPRLSPDGKRLSWLAPRDGVLNVWVAPLDDLASKRPVTADKKRGIRVHAWAYTNEHVLYAQDEGGDENWRLYSVALATDAALDLTPMKGVQARIVQASPKKPTELLLGINDRDPKWHDTYRVDLTTGKRTLVEKNDGKASYVADDELALRFATASVKGGGYSVLQKKGAKWAPFATIALEDTRNTNLLGLDAAGKELFWTTSIGRDRSVLARVSLASGKSEVIAESPKADVVEVLAHPTTRMPRAAASEHLRKDWVVLDPSIVSDFEALGKVAAGDFQITSQSLDDQRWVVAFTLDTAAARYYLWDRPSQKATFLMSERPELDKLELARMTPVLIPARDGLQLPSYFTLPKARRMVSQERADAPSPLVLFVHGGPWARDRFGYHPYHQWLADRGYAVLSVNFRGSTGFGKSFVNASNHEWGGKMHDDLVDAVKWAIDRGITRPEQVAIMGGSYGGYATLVGLTVTPKTFACGVDIVGPSNLITLFESIPPYWESFKEEFLSRVGDSRTEAGRKLLVERSPLTLVERIERPLLIGQGANDPRVKQAESDQIVGAMKAKSIPVTYVLYPDEGHGFARPENRTSFNAVAEAFLAGCLKGRAEPIGHSFRGSSIEVPHGAEHVVGLADALAGHERP
ncbi:MAG: S9 family peptidase [Polyangiaceae bacterium]|nr:S9 family peptidase [Polyangiaceae bacterium]